MIYNQLRDYLEDNSILCDAQSGFRSLHSTATALLHASNDWLDNIDKGLLNAVVFLDLAKAFDTVDHSILLRKLEIYGINGVPLDWFKSYLNHRSQYCYINGQYSTESQTLCGVPQGSTLGPLLFLLYINDLPRSVTYSCPRMYADDTTLSASGASTKDIENKLNSDLANVKLWLEANKLSLNVFKTEFMLLGSSPGLFSLLKLLKLGLLLVL